MSPLLGLAFQSDQRSYMYLFAHRIGTNPLPAIRKVINEIGVDIELGKFWPLGRLIVYLEEAGRFEVAAATGIPPHIVQGVTRLLMIALLALSATFLVSALHRSAGHFDNENLSSSRSAINTWLKLPPPIGAFPIILASILIVTGTHHPISLCPFFLIAITITLILIPLYIASDNSLAEGTMTKIELFTAVLIGIFAAITYEPFYLLPIVCLVILILWVKLSGLTNRSVI